MFSFFSFFDVSDNVGNNKKTKANKQIISIYGRTEHYWTEGKNINIIFGFSLELKRNNCLYAWRPEASSYFWFLFCFLLFKSTTPRNINLILSSLILEEI